MIPVPSVAKKNEKIVRPSVRSVVRSSVRSFVRPFVRSFVRSSVRECARIAKTRKKRRKRRKKRKNRSASKMKDLVVTIHFVQFSSKSELSSGGKRPFKVFSFSHFFFGHRRYFSHPWPRSRLQPWPRPDRSLDRLHRRRRQHQRQSCGRRKMFDRSINGFHRVNRS